MNEESRPIARTDLRIPRACGNCGTEEGVQRFVLTTGAGGASNSVMAWCQECAQQVALALIRTWDVSGKPMPFREWTCEHCHKQQPMYGAMFVVILHGDSQEMPLRICAECHHALTRQHAILRERK